MNIFSFIQLFGGLAFFLFGMNLMSTSLEKMAGGKLEKLLQKATDNKFKGLLIGAIITIAIQSSSAMTVMLVGFVNSGLMELGQTIGVIFGSDIGTTLTAWILSLTGIESEGNIALGLLKPANFSLIFALVGIMLFMVGKTQKKKYLGSIFLGFAILMTGMTMMSGSMSPLAESPRFSKMLTAFDNPVIGLLIGTLITGVIQSSAASIGMIQSLSLTGQMTFGMAIPLVLGANIGTCMTAILSSIGVSKNAKRVAAVHVSVKVIGAVFWLALFYGLNAVFSFAFMGTRINPVMVAGVHTIFNALNVALLFPFSGKLEKLARGLIKDSGEEQEYALDERLMITPSIAIAECEKLMHRLIQKTVKCLNAAMDLMADEFDMDQYNYIESNEGKIDKYEDEIGSYLMKLSTSQSLSEEEKKRTTSMLQTIGEFERASDHSLMIANTVKRGYDTNMDFSDDAHVEIGKLVPVLKELYNTTAESFEKKDAALASRVEPLNDVIKYMCGVFREKHVERQTLGLCTAQQGHLYDDLLTSAGRIGGHCMNVAAIIIRMDEIGKTGSYMHDIKHRDREAGDPYYTEYYEKYIKEIQDLLE